MIRTSLLISVLAGTLSAAPQLQLSTTSIGPIHIFPNAAAAQQVVEAYNSGTGSLNLTAAVSAPWLSAAVGPPRACTTRSGNCTPINLSFNVGSLPSGTTTGYVTVTDPNAIDSPQQISVTVNTAGIPASLTAYVTPVGGARPATSFPIFTQGPVTATVNTQSGGSWLSFLTGGLINTGSPYNIQVAAQNGMNPGSYTGTVTLSGSNAADNKTITVTLNVSNSPLIGSDIEPVQLSSFSGGPKPSATVSFSNIGPGTLAITGATASSSSGNFLSASVATGSSVTVTANPATLTPGLYSGSVTLTSNASNNSEISVPVLFTVEATGTPLIYSGGIVNIGNYVSENVSPGDILAIFGDQLTVQSNFAVNPGLPPLATNLGNVQVLVNGVPAPLYYVSANTIQPEQINFQLPYETPVGQVASVQVVANGKAGNLRPLNVVASVPRLLIWPVIAGNYSIAVNQDYSLVLPSATTIGTYVSRPAKAGDTITIYCTGLGQTTPTATTGAAASSSPLQAVSNVTVTFGGVFNGTPVTVPAYFAGLTPTAVGLYQVNATLPPDVPVGSAIAVTVNVNGAVSNPAYIAVSN